MCNYVIIYVAAINVLKMEGWRRSVLLENTKYFASLTELNIYNPVISIVVENEETVLKAHRFPSSTQISSMSH
jgi:hypothetical protein